MAASGLNQTEELGPNASNAEKWGHLAALTEFALALKETLTNINKESFNNFVLRIGINQGPITAGVIGARKPHYDMWGNTVNVASRMESTGKAGSIQVVQETRDLLEEFGYKFEQRGMVSVKGKGMLRTFYLVGGPND
jgi:adenylate cyclase 3